MSEEQLKNLKQDLETTKGLLSFYKKQLEEKNTKTLEHFVSFYEGKLEGLENVFYTLEIKEEKS